jgi:hypothetical protein
MRRIGIITAFGALLCLSATAEADIVVTISKSQQRLAVQVDGAELYRWPVSTGRRGHATPNGTFHPTHLERHWYSHQYQMTPMPWAMFFFRGYAVHGTMEAYNLGHAASHGCVRLRPDHAATLFSMVHKRSLGETKVVVRDGPLPPVPNAVPMADASHDVQRVASEVAKSPPLAAQLARAEPDDGYVDVSIPPRDIPARRVERRADTVEISLVAHAQVQPLLLREPVPSLQLARGGDAAVLRSRQAWLRGLAHKYGFSAW